MDTKNKAAGMRPQAASESNEHRNNIRLPAYGKAIVEARRKGLAPSDLVVSLCWNLGKAFHRVIIPDDLPADRVDLRFCVGLDVFLAYRQDQAEKARLVADKLLSLNPKRLISVGIGQPPVLMFLKEAPLCQGN